MRLLIEKGASLNIRNNSGNSALILATCYNHKEAALLLIEKGADMEVRDNNGDTALAIASKRRLADMAQTLEYAAETRRRLAEEKAAAEAAEEARLIRETVETKRQHLKELAQKNKPAIKPSLKK
jgi:ankyrin repeat protein